MDVCCDYETCQFKTDNYKCIDGACCQNCKVMKNLFSTQKTSCVEKAMMSVIDHFT